MLDFKFDKMLFCVSPEEHTSEKIREIIQEHPEVKFVSLVGIDIGGHDTDEKIPVAAFLEDLEKLLREGVQTDGSSVVLPKIADLNNAKVDIIPDLDVNWYVDYNYDNIEAETGLPVGTLRIPSFLVHNDKVDVGSRVILRDAIRNFKSELMSLLKEHPYVFDYMEIDSVDDIEKIEMTSATELEFWVKTPDDKADREQLTTAQVLKEQYWKRTVGPVRSALENTMKILDFYGFEMEMGHKEVGGIKAKMGNSGHYDHVMEQLEIDWKYSSAIQAADNENHIKNVVRDIFSQYGLQVTFMAKPMEGVAGSGEHTHLGIAVKLKNGKRINLFETNRDDEFLNPVGYGACMGILKNYEVLNPFISSSNDAMNRLKPGYEAPVCIVTSMGHSVEQPSRNRTVLLGLIRDRKNPLSTRFELRSPNPKSNTYLVIASAYMAMMDGIKAVLENEKNAKELEKSISKLGGEDDFYLEKDREYRSERDVFDEYTPEERNRIFGVAPKTVWDNLKAFTEYPEKTKVLKENDVMSDLVLESYREAVRSQWATELHDRLIPNAMDTIRRYRKLHTDGVNDFDDAIWEEINSLRLYLGKDTLDKRCLLTEIKEQLDSGDYDRASELQSEMNENLERLTKLYIKYRKNLF